MEASPGSIGKGLIREESESEAERLHPKSEMIQHCRAISGVGHQNLRIPQKSPGFIPASSRRDATGNGAPQDCNRSE